MIYDISQELFSADVYPGDPVPQKETVFSLKKQPPDMCNLTKLQMGSHSGTHLDAPLHFYEDSKDVSQIALGKCMGKCKIVFAQGRVEEEQIKAWLEDDTERLLVKGKIILDSQSAEILVKRGIQCIGVEQNTVGEGEEQRKVHLILLAAQVVILEGIRLGNVPEGEYFLSAVPLKMQGVDGSPVRAVLYKE